MAEFQAAAYLRYSYTDDRSSESDSIDSQRHLIEGFVAQHPDIELVSERVDDGYSGILFDRSAFQEMMTDIKNGVINCVIVKDISRLGRERIETDRHLSYIFPAFGVRFVAVTDGIDTENKHAGDDLVISIKSVLNDAYCRDISVKTRSALQAKRKNGDYVGACPVYGYQRDPEDKNHLMADEYAARVVKDIYRRRIDGASAARIAEELNRMGVLSPLAYKISRGLPHPTGGYADHPDAKWSAVTVARILRDETYTGTLIQGKQTTYNYKLRNLLQKPADEWVRTENAHEAIVAKRDYDLVQRLTQLDTRAGPAQGSVYLFSGLLICGCCGGRMTRKTNTYKGQAYIYYHCPTGKKHGCAHPARIREDVLIQCVLTLLQTHIKSVISLEELLSNLSEERISRGLIEGYKAQIMENEAQLSQTASFQSTLYENFANGIIDKDEYIARADTKIDNVPITGPDTLAARIEDCQEQKRSLYERFVQNELNLEEYRNQKTELDEELVQLKQTLSVVSAQIAQQNIASNHADLLRQAQEAGHVTADLVTALIERIEVHPTGQVELVWKSFS